ncbi:MAG: hypothetical protein ACRENL_01540 [Candidatus Dormibacteria bacterium]
MPTRKFAVVHDLIGFPAGATVSETQLVGCNVAALIEGGFLLEQGKPADPTQLVPPSATPLQGG